MAKSGGKIRCIICEKEKVSFKCEGCLQYFCLNHLTDHQKELQQQFDQIEDQRNLFFQTLDEQKQHSNKSLLIQQINQWEKKSIEKIQQTAEEQRKFLTKYLNEHINKLEAKLNELTKQLKDIRNENDFNEIILNDLKQELKELEKQLHNPTNILIKQDLSSSSFINKISVIISSNKEQLNIAVNAKWEQNGKIVAGENEKGKQLNQLNRPWSIDLNDEQIIYVCDTDNHRIVEWKNSAINGLVVAGGNEQGNRNDQLNDPKKVIINKENDSLIITDYGNRRVVRWPRQNGTSGEIIISNINCFGLAMDNNGYLYVSDIDKHEVRRWTIGEKDGILVAGGNEKGDRLDQLNRPEYIFVDQNESVYVSDCYNHRVVKWIKGAKEGIVIAGGHSEGNILRQLWYPRGIIVDQLGTLYVTDSGNNRVMRWLQDAKEGSVVVGRNGNEQQANQLNTPVDLSFDQWRNLYVIELNKHCVQKFLIN